ncbi:hypothetical protein JCGZ_22382 [Jatropha curcas]|uniref:C2H2-type domain-containing protein n=1 Tax=Jatropha curcas TaxID=180498 RepID=A0A067LGT5_JATCU|nr:uncharacterized protein LOC110008882 [Jatropha curcas]KDP43755.1 hypothetical protein JCGZ_22382 [Jatropha curcas]
MANFPQKNPAVPSSSSSSSSSSSTPPPPPPPPPSILTVGHGGSTSRGGGNGASGEGSSRKRSYGVSVSSSISGGEGQVKRKKGELIDPPKSDPICSLCDKRFGSWKGVFGHLRAHPERDWRGAFPPPKRAEASWSPIRIGNAGQQVFQGHLLAPTLLNLAHQTLAKMRHDIDLNREPQDAAGPSAPPPPPPQGGNRRCSFDLNLPPPPENGDENDNHKE